MLASSALPNNHTIWYACGVQIWIWIWICTCIMCMKISINWFFLEVVLYLLFHHHFPKIQHDYKNTLNEPSKSFPTWLSCFFEHAWGLSLLTCQTNHVPIHDFDMQCNHTSFSISHVSYNHRKPQSFSSMSKTQALFIITKNVGTSYQDIWKLQQDNTYTYFKKQNWCSVEW